MKIELHVQPPSDKNINWSALVDTIANHITEIDPSALTVKQFTAGYSNLTYLLQFPTKELVLRRPPFGKIPPKAHNMEREYHIIRRIHPVFPLAPKPFLYEHNENIMEKHFYVMEKKEGVVLDDEMPSEWQNKKNVEQQVSEAVVNTISQLHSIDIYKHELNILGKPEGYLERQVNGWIKRYEKSLVEGNDIVKEIIPWFLHHVPHIHSYKPTIVHNDFKLNNMMFSKENPEEVTAVFDWEMTTVGDPLLDIAGTVAYWTEPEDKETGLASVTQFGSFYSRRELLEAYANKTGRDLDDIHFYVSFAFFKIAVILQQIYYRWHHGEITDDRFANLGIGINNLLEQSLRAKNKELF